MRNFIAKLAVTAGVGIAALALPATSAFAGTTSAPDPTPTVTQIVTPPDNHHGDNWNKGDNKGHENDRHGNDNRGCKDVTRFFSNTLTRDDDNRDNDWTRGNDWRCFGHHQTQCTRCVAQSFFFNVRKGSTHFTEVSGPVLHTGELIRYNGVAYRLINVSGHSFQVTQLWSSTPIRAGASHWYAHAITVCPRVVNHHGWEHGNQYDHGFLRQ